MPKVTGKPTKPKPVANVPIKASNKPANASCVACGNTGRSSKGGVCGPCAGTGKVGGNTWASCLPTKG